MLEALVTFILVIVGVVLIIFILGYGIYITFYPLSKTVKGGLDAMKEHTTTKEKGKATVKGKKKAQSRVSTTKVPSQRSKEK